MKNTSKLTFMLFLSLLIASCGGSESKTESQKAVATTEAEAAPAAKNKGVGPIKSITLAAEIDTELAKKGEEIFKAKCSACHRLDKKFIGPSPKGVLERREPEWIMNMILNPEVMIVEDPDAKALMMEFNGAPMANQNLTEDEARSVLEYFRTL
ncbi:c-type cytochrome [Arcticibacterium luteifluviistationis]|uniref:Cytochrome C n=1 Tax=Arcticibacterium luteifluviistationis TaxID=1784714 RepID=A0A2Z4GIM7_9BACT|nr:cytochrome c [Arcticibacterium luteifluviistationis]AWW00968.1 cytochrome C [Arcticibacterium luteifluviistationis]